MYASYKMQKIKVQKILCDDEKGNKSEKFNQAIYLQYSCVD